MIIHLKDLPEKRNYIILKRKFMKIILKILEDKKYPWKIRNKIKNGKISIKKLKNIFKKENISLKKIENNVYWIGGNNSKGLSNPRSPINFATRSGARFIAAIINDGTLTKEGKNSHGRLMYDNFDKSQRESIIKDYLNIFGGNKNEIAFRNTEKKKYLEFSSITRDIVELVIKAKGPKCESNLLMPEFILKNKETMLGWVEQTIADEGEVKYNPKKYRRAIAWRRSLDITNSIKHNINKETSIRQLPKKIQILVENQKCNLIEYEKKILDSLGINYLIFNLGIYPTTKNKIRTKWQILIQKRENLLKLRKLITIPSKEKNKKFSQAVKSYIRYKEIPNIRKTILKLGRGNKNFTAKDFKRRMNYKNIGNTYKWLKIFEKQGLIKKIKESKYGQGRYRRSAEYKLIF
ncbi:MAG: hypothetical protein KJ674_05330 [Nanoarchaeota archaeon]|nr:hypothetical protein [Nanoarchaeota archaeon]